MPALICNRYGKMLMALGNAECVPAAGSKAGAKRKAEPGPKAEPKRQRVHAVRYAITFGEVAILHVGGSELGAGRRDEG